MTDSIERTEAAMTKPEDVTATERWVVQPWDGHGYAVLETRAGGLNPSNGMVAYFQRRIHEPREDAKARADAFAALSNRPASEADEYVGLRKLVKDAYNGDFSVCHRERADFIGQARRDAALVASYSPEKRVRLDAETDWNGYRMRGYEFGPAALSRPAGATEEYAALRKLVKDAYNGDFSVCHRAADLIERLARELAGARAGVSKARAEIELSEGDVNLHPFIQAGRRYALAALDKHVATPPVPAQADVLGEIRAILQRISEALAILSRRTGAPGSEGQP